MSSSTYYIHDQLDFVNSNLHLSQILEDIVIKNCTLFLIDLNNSAIKYLITIGKQHVANKVLSIQKTSIFFLLQDNISEYLWLSYINYILHKVVPSEFYGADYVDEWE